MLAESEATKRGGMDMSVGPNIRIDDTFRAVVAEAPERLALVTLEASYTYADVDRWSDAIASDIVARDAPVDRPIAIVTASNARLVPCLLAAVKAGHFFVMIDATDPGDRIAVLLRESSAALCVVDSIEDPPEAAADLSLVEIRPFSVGNHAAAPPRKNPNPLLLVAYTSGTTGRPKAIATAQEGFVPFMLELAPRWGCGPDMRQLYPGLPGYVRSATMVFRALLVGATLYAFDPRNESLRSLADFIARHRIEVLPLTPSLFRRLLAANPDGIDLSSVKRCRLGADRVTIADIEAFKKHFPRGTSLHLGFASTESGAVFGMDIDHDTPISGPLVPMGRLLEGVEVWLLDDEGDEVPIGDVGELVVRSRQVVEGYWNDPELTAERFAVDPEDPSIRTFRTGDLAKRDADGLYYFVGRKDARLKVRGRRIDPSEVESALMATGIVREAVIVGKADARGEQELVAYVVLRDGAPRAPRAIRRLLRGEVPVWMIPAKIHALEAIPLTGAAKIDRAALVARVDESAPEDDGARDQVEKKLVEIWSRSIGRPVHVDDDFFDDLGGDSLMAAHIAADVGRELSKSVTPSLMLELNTIAKMAEYVRGADEAVRHVIEIQKGTFLPPLFCAAGGGGGVLSFRLLASELGPDQPFWGLHTHEFELETIPETMTGLAAAYVHAIRLVQPAGPYFLAGYSWGGKLAYEIGRQLLAAGERVAFLGLIDTSAVVSRASTWKRLRNRLAILRRNPQRTAAFAKEAAVRPSEWMMNRVVRKLLGRRIAVPPKIVRNTMLLRGVSKTYTFPFYPGTLTLFLARNGMRRVRVQQDLGWGSLVRELEILDVDGDHETVLTQPHVRSLAGALRNALAAARRRV